MLKVVAYDRGLELAGAAIHVQLVFDPVVTRALLARHKEPWLDVFSTKVDYSLVLLEVENGTLKHGVRQVLPPLHVSVDTATEDHRRGYHELRCLHSLALALEDV